MVKNSFFIEKSRAGGRREGEVLATDVWSVFAVTPPNWDFGVKCWRILPFEGQMLRKKPLLLVLGIAGQTLFLQCELCTSYVGPELEAGWGARVEQVPSQSQMLGNSQVLSLGQRSDFVRSKCLHLGSWEFLDKWLDNILETSIGFFWQCVDLGCLDSLKVG